MQWSATVLSAVLLVWGSKTAAIGRLDISFGLILPHTSLLTLERRYNKVVLDAVADLVKSRHTRFNFTSVYNIRCSNIVKLTVTPSPTEILSNLCNDLLKNPIAALIYISNPDVYGSSAASAQYLLQLMGYLGIPVIAWNADNIGLKKRVSESKILQMAPSVDHQVAAMISILGHYKWPKFSVLTSQIGGHENFIRAVRERVHSITEFKIEILDIYTVAASPLVSDEALINSLRPLAESETRVLLLYASEEEAKLILTAATALNITGKDYIWVVTQSVIGKGDGYRGATFPPGLFGVHFNTNNTRLQEAIERAILVFGYGLDLYVNDPRNKHDFALSNNLNCNGTQSTRWNKGDYFFGYLRNVSFGDRRLGHPNIEFHPDGTLKYVELEIMNLNKMGIWEKIGVWTERGIDIKDIVWPGGSNVPPPGVPEKFNLKVAFMDEPSYVNLVPLDGETGECKISRAVRCRIAVDNVTGEPLPTPPTKATSHPSSTRWRFMCCSGFCIDLLQKFANDLRFSYDLYRVEDGKWGALHNETWNGLIADLLHGRADIVVTSFKINSDRQRAVDFTVPFLETGISIVVAKRTGIISPKAFLEPFDTISWIMILLVCIQVSALGIFLFEFCSPYGYDMKMIPPRDHRFSLFRTFWLVWAILFGAAVNVDCPKGYTARFMANVWAMFAVVFLAIYTANLAAFMITREEFYDLKGIEDDRLQNPRSTFPPFRYGTIPHGNTETVLKRNKPELYSYMKPFNKPYVMEGIRAVKKGDLDAFIYDATVLEYLVGQDSECKLLTVGSWYAMTGYGFALPKKSSYLHMFNRKMIEYRENGDLERLQRFWLQGACKPTKNKRNVSKPLDVNQFMSAFLLLGCGVLFTLLLLVLEHVYFRYVRQHLARKNDKGCFTLLSLSVGKSLSFEGAVFEAQQMLKGKRCNNVMCDNQLWKVRKELDLAKTKIASLEAELGASRNGAVGSWPLNRRNLRAGTYYRDFTREHFQTNDPRNYYLPRLKGAHISEIETVL